MLYIQVCSQTHAGRLCFRGRTCVLDPVAYWGKSAVRERKWGGEGGGGQWSYLSSPGLCHIHVSVSLSLSAVCLSVSCLFPQQIPHPWALFKLLPHILWGGYAVMTLCCHSSINGLIAWPWTICFEKIRQCVHTVLEYGHRVYTVCPLDKTHY